MPRIVDRRVSPSYGYRAVHVIVCLDGVTIEIQVRTLMQHVWADLMERLADRLGRQIRYGQPPTPPAGMSQQRAQSLIDAMMATSDNWAANEPATAREAALDVDRITEDVWSAMSEALRKGGVDL